MNLEPGTRIGVYEIVAKLGEGGMGQVYRGRDTNLKRQVAIKVLPEAMAADADRLMRFQREAEVLAALNHPNIAAIYGVERTADATALVMELVEGDDLSVLISRAAGLQGIPLADALPIARQITDALEAAHDLGIIHRDLKPANIKVRADGTVKVLDFGLAKAMDRTPDSGQGTRDPGPTMTSPALTQMGLILGTAAYMSPEQASGKPVDKRSDLWSFGVVLLEMLTGQRPFEGETVSHVIASVLKDAPDLSALPADTPASIRQLLRRCLEKDRKKRLDSAGAARLEIDDAIAGVSAAPAGASSGSAITMVAPVWTRGLPWAAATVFAIVAIGALVMWSPWTVTPAPMSRRLLADIGADASLVEAHATALSPDGTTLVFAAEQGGVIRLFVRTLDQLEARAMPGTEGASAPFFSPDSRSVAFFAGTSLKRVFVTGGAALPIAEVGSTPLAAGSWAEDGTIFYSGAQSAVIMQVPSAGGGTPEAYGTLSEGATSQRAPHVLPGGAGVLCTEYASGPGNTSLVILPPGGGPPRPVLKGGYFGRYLPSGHLVYMQEGTLFGVGFDLERRAVVGESVPVLKDVLSYGWSGVVQLAFSADGTVVYVPSEVSNLSRAIDWTSRDGHVSPLMAKQVNWANPRFSPNGENLAMDVGDDTQRRHIWVYEWSRNQMTQLTFGAGNELYPVWSPDGRQIVFFSIQPNESSGSLRVMNADGTGEQTQLLSPGWSPIPMSWKSDGTVLAFLELAGASASHRLSMLPLARSADQGWTAGAPTVFYDSPASDAVPQFSPDDRWVAYASDEGGTYNIWVKPFTGTSGPWKISQEGGQYPRWSKTANELLFLSPDGKVLYAPYSVEGDSFRADTPRLWTPTLSLRPGGAYPYDIHPDGTRLAVAAAIEQKDVVRDHVVVMNNFFDYVTRMVEGRQ